MFIDLNNLKGIIIDLDSFPEGEDLNWNEVEESVEILFFSAADTARLDKIAIRNPRLKTYHGAPTSIFAKKKVLMEILSNLGLPSYDVAFLSSDYENLVIIQELPIATIQYAPDDLIAYDEVGKLADFQISSIADLKAIIQRTTGGYFAEALSVIFNRGSRLEFQTGGVIVTAKDYQGFRCDVVSGGRYFNTNDVRFPYHQLSQRILQNKRLATRQDDVFRTIYRDLIRFINENIQAVDGITRIPPRPSDGDDRFRPIVDSICMSNQQYQNHCSHLKCIKDYPSQKGLNEQERQANILGAFVADPIFAGKHVVLIDDVISTGATAFEAAKMLYQSGASRVTILVLAINQLTNNIRRHHYKPLLCGCGGQFRMRFNSQNHSAFFGCSGYPTCRATLNYFEGLERHNIENEIIADEDIGELNDWEF